MVEEGKVAAPEATEIGRIVTEMLQEMKTTRI